MSQSAAENLFALWDTYEKVVAGNYMFHREIAEEITRALSARFDGTAFSILDLGCGDAATFAPLLKGLAVARYKGVDLSQAALALAAKKLSVLRGPVELVHADILSALSEAGSFDAIYTSFVLHHLSTDEKAEAFRRAARRLAANGLLLLVDVVREEDETLPVYYRRYCDWLRRDWTGLDPREREAVCDHIVANDLPEPYSVLETQADAAGLTRAPGGARHGWHRLMCFTRAGSQKQ